MSAVPKRATNDGVSCGEMGGLYRVVSSVTVSRHCVHGSCVAVSLAGLCIRLLVLVRMGSGQAVGHNY